jgi:hypothetical protein
VLFGRGVPISEMQQLGEAHPVHVRPSATRTATAGRQEIKRGAGH